MEVLNQYKVLSVKEVCCMTRVYTECVTFTQPWMALSGTVFHHACGSDKRFATDSQSHA